MLAETPPEFNDAAAMCRRSAVSTARRVDRPSLRCTGKMGSLAMWMFNA